MKLHKFSLDVGVLHLIGIGGIGMSGIAEVLHNLGYKVQGSDGSDSYNTKRLEGLGVKVFIGHKAEHVDNASVVVISSAIKADNPELVAARAARLPVVRRAEMLAELMRFKTSIAVAGTHGKTTTTALTAAMLEAAKLQPTVINGGIINARNTNAYLGAGEWMVVEADESDGTFTRLPATIAVITNIDPEHLDHYGSFDNAKAAFQTFLTNLPFYGFAVLCIDHPEVQALAARVSDRRIVTYGTNPQADIRAFNLRSGPDGETFDIEIDGRTIKDMLLPMHGHHNVRNALAAIGIAQQLGISDDTMRAAFRDFGGVKRRFTKTGEGLGITVIDDYGHHPVEIAATLKAARAAQSGGNGKVIAVVQPHRYTRVRDLFSEFCTCFNDADTVIVADIYSAGEEPIEDITADKLVEGLQSAGHKHVLKLESPEELAAMVAEVGEKGDMVVCLGAGSITKWAYALPEQLQKLKKKKGGVMMAAEKITDTHPLHSPPFAPFSSRLRQNADLSKTNWFRVGGPAEYVFRPEDAKDLSAFLQLLPAEIPVTVLGVGSNVIVRDGGVDGVVIKLGRGFTQMAVDDENLSAGAAALDLNVALFACEQGLAGLEFLSGVPGTIGGGVRMNAGAYGSDVSQILLEAEIVERSGKIRTLSSAELQFSYRNSALPEGAIVTKALFKTQAGDKGDIAKKIREITSAREETQPVRSRTGGSTFKNPEGQKAWELIDQAGCRGLTVGGAQMSDMHCNFMINAGNATAADLETLGEEVIRRVRGKTGIMLEWEIKRIGKR